MFGVAIAGLNKPPTTAYQPQTSNRPKTSNQSVNYKKTKSSTLIQKAESIDELPEEALEEEKIKEMEKKVLNLGKRIKNCQYLLNC